MEFCRPLNSTQHGVVEILSPSPRDAEALMSPCRTEVETSDTCRNIASGQSLGALRLIATTLLTWPMRGELHAIRS